eukprot:RCo031325
MEENTLRMLCPSLSHTQLCFFSSLSLPYFDSGRSGLVTMWQACWTKEDSPDLVNIPASRYFPFLWAPFGFSAVAGAENGNVFFIFEASCLSSHPTKMWPSSVLAPTPPLSTSSDTPRKSLLPPLLPADPLHALILILVMSNLSKDKKRVTS